MSIGQMNQRKTGSEIVSLLQPYSISNTNRCCLPIIGGAYQLTPWDTQEEQVSFVQKLLHINRRAASNGRDVSLSPSFFCCSPRITTKAPKKWNCLPFQCSIILWIQSHFRYRTTERGDWHEEREKVEVKKTPRQHFAKVIVPFMVHYSRSKSDFVEKERMIIIGWWQSDGETTTRKVRTQGILIIGGLYHAIRVFSTGQWMSNDLIWMRFDFQSRSRGLSDLNLHHKVIWCGRKWRGLFNRECDDQCILIVFFRRYFKSHVKAETEA